MTTARYQETVEASALVARPDGQFAVEPVLVPGPGRDNIVVQIAYSGVSIGTEFGALSGKIDWGGFPMVTGYMATGTVSMVGSAVTGFAPAWTMRRIALLCASSLTSPQQSSAT